MPLVPPIRSVDDQTEKQRALRAEITRFKDRSTQATKSWRNASDDRYGLYRNYTRQKRNYRQGTGAERGAVILDAQRDWGANLFIPLTFSTIETIVPRVLSNDPMMKALPYKAESKAAAEAVKSIFERDQRRIGYEQKLQSTTRDGFIYGLGVQKTYWQRKTRTLMQTAKSSNSGKWIAQRREQVLYEGPQAESVDIGDFFWDTPASSMENCEKALHRTWRSSEYVLNQMKRLIDPQQPEMGTIWQPIDPEVVRGLGSETARNELWARRLEASGQTNTATNGERMHEVWEYWTQDRVVTVLDKQFIVQDAENPAYHGELPFQIFRPTLVPHEFCGIGVPEQMEQLQLELNTLRSQRRDNAMMILNRSFFYQEGFMNPDDAKLAPGKGVPVLGSPRDSIWPIDIGEIPNSGYQEETAIKSDVESTTGVSENLAAGSIAPGDTATGTQLGQSAANMRISLASKNLMRETVRPAACQWLALYKQHYLEEKQIRVEDGASEDGYKFVNIGPEDFQQIENVEPEAGSTEPDNPAQRQENSMRVFQSLIPLAENGVVDPRKLTAYYLKENDVKDASSFLMPEGPAPAEQVQGAVQHIADALEQYGMEPQAIEQVLASATADLGPAPDEQADPGNPQTQGAQSGSRSQ